MQLTYFIIFIEALFILTGCETIPTKTIQIEPITTTDWREVYAKQYQSEYFKAYEKATSLARIRDFEKKYSDHDPDKLIERLAPKKRELEHNEYMNSFNSAKSSKDLSLFISNYQNNDPKNLIPEAQRRLSVAEKKEYSENEIRGLEKEISSCKNQIAGARKVISREKKIGAVSGYVNKLALHQAGEIIVFCEEILSKQYVNYRRLGGNKSLVDIQ